VDVMVLEARDRVGGRVHSYQGPFGAAVDLGASLITGERGCWVWFGVGSGLARGWFGPGL